MRDPLSTGVRRGFAGDGEILRPFTSIPRRRAVTAVRIHQGPRALVWKHVGMLQPSEERHGGGWPQSLRRWNPTGLAWVQFADAQVLQGPYLTASFLPTRESFPATAFRVWVRRVTGPQPGTYTSHKKKNDARVENHLRRNWAFSSRYPSVPGASLNRGADQDTGNGIPFSLTPLHLPGIIGHPTRL